jgi:hypothetical protein
MTTYYRTDYTFYRVEGTGYHNAIAVHPDTNMAYTKQTTVSDYDVYNDTLTPCTEAEFNAAFIRATVQLARKAGIDLAQVRKEVEV